MEASPIPKEATPNPAEAAPVPTELAPVATKATPDPVELHWTYREIKKESNLEQGDILVPSPELKALLEVVHPHFAKPKYVGFLITTQTCDLVRRGDGEPKTPYINLAVIRPLAQVSEKLFAKVASPLAPGIYPKQAKGAVEENLKKLFNQNEQSLGLFFLQTDIDSGIGEPSVAFLRVGVAVRATHYDTLIKCREGGLRADFQAKLGWMCGNLFDRPSTPDWGENDGGKKGLKELISTWVAAGDLGIIWMDKEIAARAAERGWELASLTKEQLKQITPKPPLEQALEAMSEIARKLGVEEAVITQLKGRLRNRDEFIKQMR